MNDMFQSYTNLMRNVCIMTRESEFLLLDEDA
jgi:hypothetical protein